MMTKKYLKDFYRLNKYVWPIATLLFTSACLPNISNTLRKRSSATTTTLTTNGQGYILADNPIILSGNSSLSPSTNLNAYTSVAMITTNTFLTSSNSCYGTNGSGYCFQVKADDTQTSALQTSTGKWGHDTGTAEFLQVNTFFHVNKIIDRFFADMNVSYANAYNGTTAIKDTSLPSPSDMYKNINQYNLIMNSPLNAYANCNAADNAYYSSATNSLCMGYISSNSAMKWAQDSSAIYHETGHFIQHMLLNLNNFNQPAGTKNPHMGNYQYDEASAIGEGLSDFFSYYINQRTHFSEWGAGRVLNASRPISEDDALHVSSLAKDASRRLSYPEYIDYNPNDHTVPTEDIHLSGMVISHFLTAFTEDLMDKCAYSKRDAQSQVFMLLAETMAELGDLNSKGLQASPTKTIQANRINLSASKSYDWIMKNNPINYRSFSQTFAKNVLNSLSNATTLKCNGTIYSQDALENLLDEYGLLLFRQYNENRNFADPAVAALNNTPINPTNRTKTILINKSNVILDPTTTEPAAYIIDKRETILKGLAALKASGIISSTSDITPTDLGYNNGNGRISRGEVVAVGLNLYNNSNSTMGGIQVLANDWKNLSVNGKPCIYTSSYSNDYNWTSIAEGGEPCGPGTDVPVEYRSDMSAATTSDFQPICSMQYYDSTATKWVSQHTFRSKIALDDSYCLGGKGADKDCFIRAIKGADQAYYSKLNPKKNWYQTMQNPNSDSAYVLDWSNVILFEVSKHIPQGTVIDCRFRVRFTNCEDCYHDSTRSKYDYKDVEFNGPRPFQVVHLKFTVTD